MRRAGLRCVPEVRIGCPMSQNATKTKKDKFFRVAVGVVIGSVLGLGYYALIGCRTGGCALTSSPYLTTTLGALAGGLIAWE